MSDAAAELRTRLAEQLRTAQKSRDQTRIETLRSLMAALDNAGAVPHDTTAPRSVSAGPADVPRRQLGKTDVTDILEREADERRTAADQYERAGHAERAAQLRAGVAIVEAVLAQIR